MTTDPDKERIDKLLELLPGQIDELLNKYASSNPPDDYHFCSDSADLLTPISDHFHARFLRGESTDGYCEAVRAFAAAKRKLFARFSSNGKFTGSILVTCPRMMCQFMLESWQLLSCLA